MGEGDRPRRFKIDASQFPVVEVRYPDTATFEMIDAYFDQLDRLAARGKFVLIADVRPVRVLEVSPKLRSYFFEKSQQWDAGPAGHRFMGEAVVLRSKAAEMMLTAYLWFKQESYPSEAFGSLTDARMWAREVIAQGERRTGS